MGDEYLINQGAINMMTGSSSSINFFNLNLGGGTITTQPGTGTLAMGMFNGLGTLAGTYNAAPNSIIQFVANANPGTSAGSPLVLGGTGQYKFNSGLLTLPLNTIPGVLMTGGSLLLGPGFQGGSITNLTLNGINLTNTLPVTGTLTATNGTVNGVTTVANGAVLDVNAVTFNGQVTVQSGARFMVLGGSAIHRQWLDDEQLADGAEWRRGGHEQLPVSVWTADQRRDDQRDQRLHLLLQQWHPQLTPAGL